MSGVAIGGRSTILQITELGIERRCNNCGEWWPLDGEFFHRHRKGIGGYLGSCRACLAERRMGRYGRSGRASIRRSSGRATVDLLSHLGMTA